MRVRARRQRQGLCALCTALAGSHTGSGAGTAWRKHSRTCCTRPGMLQEPHTCCTRRFSLLPYLPVLSPSSSLSPWGCAHTPGPGCRSPGASHRNKEWVKMPSPSLIIPAEPFPSSLGISRQVCDSPGHLGTARVMLQPQGSSRSHPLHPRYGEAKNGIWDAWDDLGRTG